MFICFLFKADMFIGYTEIPIYQELEQPFHQIPKVEEHIKHFLHLFCMDSLMPDVPFSKYSIFSYKENTKEVYCLVTTERYDVVVNYFHCGKNKKIPQKS